MLTVALIAMDGAKGGTNVANAFAMKTFLLFWPGLTGGYHLDQDEYQSFDRDDDRSRLDVGVDWYANRALKFGASYERYDQESSGVNRDRDYTANVFMLKASLRR